MKKREDYVRCLKEIPFFKDGMHPEYLPFVGEKYPEHKILQVAESHYIPNFDKDTMKDSILYRGNEITIDDFSGWWDGNVPERISKYMGWYTTGTVVDDYMAGERHKGHSVFTNTLKVFCETVEPDKAFDRITKADSQKYHYFSYMNFWQMPTVYYGSNFSSAMYESMQFCHGNLNKKELLKKYDELWYKCFFKSVEVFEAVVKALEPNVILITSSEVGESYRKYGTQVADADEAEYEDRNGLLFKPGKLAEDRRIVWLDHPGCSWWNRRKKGETETSKQLLERKLSQMKQEGYI